MLLENTGNLWIGNEVSCGVGMQRIDVATIQYNDEFAYINIIELKCTEAYNDIIDSQIPWYITWIKDYIVPTFRQKVIITPVIISKPFTNDDDLASFKDRCSSLYLQDNDSFRIKPVKLISYTYDNNSVSFNSEF